MQVLGVTEVTECKGSTLLLLGRTDCFFLQVCTAREQLESESESVKSMRSESTETAHVEVLQPFVCHSSDRGAAVVNYAGLYSLPEQALVVFMWNSNHTAFAGLL